MAGHHHQAGNATGAGAADAVGACSPDAIDAAVQVVEARSDPRVAVDLPVQLCGPDLVGPLSARARDLGVGGICVATPYRFGFRSVRRATVLLPQGPLALEVDGRWQVDSPSEASFLTGFAFAKPEPSAVSALWDIVHGAGKALGRFLHQNSDLRALGAEGAMGIAQASRLRRVEARRFVYSQDGSGGGDDSIFILREGSLTLHYRSRPAHEVTLGRLHPGQVFGGLPIVAEVPNLESAYAPEDSSLIELSRAAFAHMRLARPILAQRLTQIVCRCYLQRLRHLLDLAAQRR